MFYSFNSIFILYRMRENRCDDELSISLPWAARIETDSWAMSQAAAV